MHCLPLSCPAHPRLSRSAPPSQVVHEELSPARDHPEQDCEPIAHPEDESPPRGLLFHALPATAARKLLVLEAWALPEGTFDRDHRASCEQFRGAVGEGDGPGWQVDALAPVANMELES